MLVLRFSRTTGRFEISGVSGSRARFAVSFRPPVDVSYREKVFTIRMDLPGVNPDDVSIEATDTEVRIVGKLEPTDNPGGPCRLMERPSGQFMRTLSFPGRIAPDRITAALADGVLTMTIPAPDLTRDPTTIEIRIEGAD